MTARKTEYHAKLQESSKLLIKERHTEKFGTVVKKYQANRKLEAKMKMHGQVSNKFNHRFLF